MHVVVGIIRNALDEILIAQRPKHKYKGGLWEFPGGKVEANENVFEALQRELKEELNIDVLTAESWLQFQYDYSDRIVLLDTWKVLAFSGIPQGIEGQAIRWVSSNELSHFQFPEGNHFILEKL
ncbi:MAG TPA: 8-oxo-dGTP diphosphatase MutT [Gammaproteobacteria bacterium]|nr:8-oxo-dGTP diphosphatase MutT [Gammaproteobacteria bacterium]